MLSIRFSRLGKKGQPYFRIIVVDKHKDPWGHYLECLGKYNPRTKELQLEKEAAKLWLSKGAQPSNSIHNLFVSQGLIEAKKVKVSKISRKRKDKLAQEDKENKAQAEAAAAKVAEAQAKAAEAAAAAKAAAEAPKAEEPKVEETK